MKETKQENKKNIELDEATKSKIIIKIIEESFGDVVDVKYVNKNKAFIFNFKNDAATSILLLILTPEDKGLAEAWNDIVKGFKDLSRSICDSFGCGYQIHVANPANPDNVLLSVMDGIVFFDFMDDE